MEFDLDPWRSSSRLFQNVYKLYEVPEADKWRLSLLKKLMTSKYEMAVCDEDIETITELIESLCST